MNEPRQDLGQQALAAHLAGSHVCQLKLVLVNAPSEAAVKLFHSTTECALEGKVTTQRGTHMVYRRYLEAPSKLSF